MAVLLWRERKIVIGMSTQFTLTARAGVATRPHTHAGSFSSLLPQRFQGRNSGCHTSGGVVDPVKNVDAAKTMVNSRGTFPSPPFTGLFDF